MRNYVSDCPVRRDVCLGIVCLGQIFLYLNELQRTKFEFDLISLQTRK
jgi:hypothetical protein